MIIDANMYWLPQSVFTDKKIQQAFLRSAPASFGTKVYKETAQKIVVERPAGYPSLNYDQNDYLLQKQIQDMDEAGIDLGVLKLPGCQEWLSLELCKVFNDALAEQVDKSNGRLKGVAVVPPYHDEEIFEELERAVFELGLTGVQLSAHYGEYYLDHELFRPFLTKVNELKLPIYVHHTPVPVDCQSLFQYNNLRRTMGRSIDQLTAVGREVFSDLFEELSDLKLIHSMMGGGIFAFVNALFPETGGNGRFDSRSSLFRKRFNENIYFEMSHAQPWGKEQLTAAVNVLGADKIIYGSSYPVKDEWFTEGPGFIRSLPLDDDQKDRMLYKNALNLYNLTTHGGS